MEFKAQTNQPVAGARPAAVQHAGGSHNSGNGRKLVATIVSLVVLLALIIAGLWIWQSKAANADNTNIDANKYQAVFMTNGQVYFGHLASLGGEYVELTDIYYLQVQQDVQPSGNNVNNSNSKVSLTKLGSELHGPTDKMNIAKDQVLFWEDLKDDSSVVKAIHDHQNK
jgi:hypothetical protein